MAGIGVLTATVVAMLAVIAIVAAMSNRSTPAKRESGPSKTIQASASYEPLAVAVASKKPSSTDAKPAADSTYVGCLRSEGDGQKLVLTEVGGKDVPQSRNWKTMFVTKKSAKLEVRPAGTLALRQHVGQTVQVRGSRVDGRIAARSVKVVGTTCS
jgi:hypothetical protein